jgi:hypothetical protein
MPEYTAGDYSTTRPSWSEPTRQSDDMDFEPSFYTLPIDRAWAGPAGYSQMTVSGNLFYVTPAYLTFGAEAYKFE